MVGNIAGGGGGAVNAGKNGDEIPCAELAVTSIVSLESSVFSIGKIIDFSDTAGDLMLGSGRMKHHVMGVDMLAWVNEVFY